MWQGVRIGVRLGLIIFVICGLSGCLTTFSLGTAARPAKSYRANETLDENLFNDLPTPQLLNFGFDLPQQELNEP